MSILSFAFLALELNNTITLGSALVAITVGLGTIVGVVYGAKWKNAALVEKANAEAYKETAERFSIEIQSLRIEVEALRMRVAELEKLPDYATLLKAITTHDERASKELSKALHQHDDHAELRTSRIIDAILAAK